MNILWLLKEHGDLDFEELADIMGSSTEPIELMSRLNKLEEEGKIRFYKNDDNITVYSLVNINV